MLKDRLYGITGQSVRRKILEEEKTLNLYSLASALTYKMITIIPPIKIRPRLRPSQMFRVNISLKLTTREYKSKPNAKSSG